MVEFLGEGRRAEACQVIGNRRRTCETVYTVHSGSVKRAEGGGEEAVRERRAPVGRGDPERFRVDMHEGLGDVKGDDGPGGVFGDMDDGEVGQREREAVEALVVLKAVPFGRREFSDGQTCLQVLRAQII